MNPATILLNNLSTTVDLVDTYLLLRLEYPTWFLCTNAPPLLGERVFMCIDSRPCNHKSNALPQSSAIANAILTITIFSPGGIQSGISDQG